MKGFLAGALLLVGCVGDSTTGGPDGGPDGTIPTGSLGGPCFTNGTCNTGLMCVLVNGAGLCETADAGLDSAPEAEASTPVVYNALDNAADWSTFDTATLGVGASGFCGGTFDGRYVYFVPSNDGVPDGVATRYDTTMAFSSSAAWSTFDTSSVDASAKGFGSAVFDGRYVYYVPSFNGTAYDGVLARYDTTLAFTATSAWSALDLGTINARGFVGGVFDGQYVYLAPLYNAGNYDGIVARIDPTMPLSTAAVTTFDVTMVNANAAGFVGAVFDGRYVYFVPNTTNAGASGVVARLDTSMSFASIGSWTTFDVATVNPNAGGFIGGAFDGRFLYLAPYALVSTPDGVTARFDTTMAFTSAASWSTFDLSTLNPGALGFQGAGFDGRYVYFVPYYNGNYHGLVTRFDTTADGGDAGWSIFDLKTINSQAIGYRGSVFDGQYLYLMPNAVGAGMPNGVVARFKAKTPRAMPNLPHWNGSFF